MVALNKKELRKLEVINDVVSGNITKKEAADKLELSTKQISRLILKYQSEGEQGFVHKARGKPNENKIQDDIKKFIVDLYITEYSDYNFTHFYEETGKEILKVSYASMCRILNEADIISPEAQHKTVKSYNEMMKKSIKNKSIINSDWKVELYEQRLKLEEEKHIRKSSLMFSFGEQVQMDAAFYMWFGDISTALHLAVDKATKKVLFGWFDYQETSRAYYILLMNVVIIYGIPEGIRTDRRGSFSINNSKFIRSNLNVTQFGRICKELNIKLETSSNPLFKPNVERENKTFKGRLKAELRHENITNIDDANKYLNDVFIPKINSKFSHEIKKGKNNMRDNIYTKEELNIIISETFDRKIDNASSIKYKSNYYMPVDKDTGEIISYRSKTKCIVISAYDDTLWCSIEDNIYMLTEVEQEKTESVKTKSKTVYKGHKPRDDHPWTFKQQTKNKERRNIKCQAK